MAFNFRELKEKEKVLCVYIGLFKNVGAFKKSVFYFREESGVQFHLWSSVMLNMQMWGIPFGTKIYLQYLGMIKGDKTNYLIKGFEVEVIDVQKRKELPHTDEKKESGLPTIAKDTEQGLEVKNESVGGIK